MRSTPVFRLRSFDPMLIGALSDEGFVYAESYLNSQMAVQLSSSLPLRREPFSAAEARPYFEGLLAEGPARQALAGTLKVPFDDWLGLLIECGRECIGDVLLGDITTTDADKSGYSELSNADLARMFAGTPDNAGDNAQLRLSLAGAQNKTGLAHFTSSGAKTGWFQPLGLAATTHILKTSYLRDLPELEFICMTAAKRCGLSVAEVSLLPLETPVLAVERFDREVSSSASRPVVARLHQEDLAQAFGVTSASKYAELTGGSIAKIAAFIRENTVSPAVDISSFAKQLCFAYAIGDCDAHLKNFSICYDDSAGAGRNTVRLSPAYDLVSTTYFPKFSRDMAMDLGNVRSIDDVSPETFGTLAKALGIAPAALRRLAGPIAEGLPDVIKTAAAKAEALGFSASPYIADDLLEDVAPRLEILRCFCRNA